MSETAIRLQAFLEELRAVRPRGSEAVISHLQEQLASAGEIEVDVALSLVGALVEAGRREEALDLALSLLGRKPDVHAYSIAAMAYEACGQYKEAARCRAVCLYAVAAADQDVTEEILDLLDAGLKIDDVDLREAYLSLGLDVVVLRGRPPLSGRGLIHTVAEVLSKKPGFRRFLALVTPTSD